MAKDTIIAGVVRGILPYAALAAVGVVGYSYLNKKGYLNGIKNAIDTAADIPSQIVNSAANFIQNKTPLGGIDDIRNGDFIGGAKKIVKYSTPIGLILDNVPDIDIPVEIPDIAINDPTDNWQVESPTVSSPSFYGRPSDNLKKTVKGRSRGL